MENLEYCWPFVEYQKPLYHVYAHLFSLSHRASTVLVECGRHKLLSAKNVIENGPWCDAATSAVFEAGRKNAYAAFPENFSRRPQWPTLACVSTCIGQFICVAFQCNRIWRSLRIVHPKIGPLYPWHNWASTEIDTKKVVLLAPRGTPSNCSL